MKSLNDAMIECKSRIASTYISWHKNNLNEETSIVLSRTCMETILKSEMIRNYKFFVITEFNADTFNELVKNKIITNPILKEFCIQTYIEALLNKKLISKNSDLYSSIKYIQREGNKDAHGNIIFTKYDVNEINKSLLRILNWFFTNAGESDWVEKFVNPQLENYFFEQSQGLSKELTPKIIAKIEEHREAHAKELKMISEEILIKVENFKGEVVQYYEEGRKKKKNYRIISITSFTILISLAFLYLYYQSKTPIDKKPHDNYSNIFIDTSKYNIIILPFLNSEANTRSRADSFLLTRLNDKDELNKLGINVACLPNVNFDHSFKMAKVIGEKIKGVDLVIWGKDFQPKDSAHHISFRYVNCSDISKNGEMPYEGETDKIERYCLGVITDGEINLEIDDIIYWFLGNKYFLKRNYKKALKIFERISNKKYRNDCLFNLTGICYYKLKSYYKAKEEYEIALKINPNSEVSHSNYASLLSNIFNDFANAKKHYETALKINPNYTEDLTKYPFLCYI